MIVIKAWKMMPMTSSPLLAASCSHSGTCNVGDEDVLQSEQDDEASEA